MVTIQLEENANDTQTIVVVGEDIFWNSKRSTLVLPKAKLAPAFLVSHARLKELFVVPLRIGWEMVVVVVVMMIVQC